MELLCSRRSALRYSLSVAWGYNFRRQGSRYAVRGTRFEVQGSGFEAEGELFDDGVGEDLAGDALDLELGRGGVGCERVLEGEEEVLTLADIGDPFRPMRRSAPATVWPWASRTVRFNVT